MSRNSYAREKFGVAVDNLATGTGSIQDRILDAWMSFHPLQERDFDNPEDGAAFKSIMERLTAVKDGDPNNGYVKNTLAKMSDDDASRLASDIVELDHALRR
jgi:hypothetical protein